MRSFCFSNILRKQFDLIALGHAVKAAVDAEGVDARRGDVGARGEVLDGDEDAVFAREGDCLPNFPSSQPSLGFCACSIPFATIAASANGKR